MTRAGFPHSDILGSRFVCQLPEAYRRLPRPSSAPSAKASTLCPYKLDHKDHSKMLASTVQFSSYDRVTHLSRPSAYPPGRFAGPGGPQADAHPTRPQADQVRDSTPRSTTMTAAPSGPNSVPGRPDHPVWISVPSPQTSCRRTRSHRNQAGRSRCSTLEHHPQLVRPGRGPGHHTPTHDRRARCQMLLRKEVIQPHLPVRLPCYDLVPIASPTFDGSPHKGWATGFGCYRLS